MHPTLTRSSVAAHIAAVIGGRMWKSDPQANGGVHVRVYPSGRGGYISVTSPDGGQSFRLRFDGGMCDGVATRCLAAGVVDVANVTLVCDAFLAPLRAAEQAA